MAGRLWALLIGIDHYPDNSGGYRSLNGCVRDVELVEAYLTDRLGIGEDAVTMLTSRGAAEPPDKTATYESIVAAFHAVTSRADPADLVYVHYSGHGARAITAFPELKGPGSFDEALVPADIGAPAGQYLRDVEISQLLGTMTGKGLVVTVVLDSCHSGGATRGEGRAVKRGVGLPDIAPRRHGGLVPVTEATAALWRARGMKPGSGWLPEPRDYTLLAACRAQESAFEFPFDGIQPMGALTYWMLEALRQAGPGLTYQTLHNRVLAGVHGRFARQTPQLQGEGDRQVFGADRARLPHAAVVLDVHGDSLRINAGQAHALRKGAVLAICPWDTGGVTAPAPRAALATITELGAAESRATVTSRLSADPITPGAQAVPVDPGDVRVRRPVTTVRRDDLPDAVPQDDLLAQARAAIIQHGTAFAPLAAAGEPAEFQVVVTERSEYEIWDPSGAPVPAITSVSDARTLARDLTHLARYLNVYELDNHDPYSPLARRLVAEIAGTSATYDPLATVRLEPTRFQDGTAIITAGCWLHLRVTNTLPRDPDDPALNVMNIAVLDLQPDLGITQIFPDRPSAHFTTLDPESSLLLPFRADLPPGRQTAVDVIKIMATFDTTSFRWLELPPLGRSPETIRSRPQRGTLEDLMAKITLVEPTKRNFAAAAEAPSRGWATSHVTAQVVRPTP